MLYINSPLTPEDIETMKTNIKERYAGENFSPCILDAIAYHHIARDDYNNPDYNEVKKQLAALVVDKLSERYDSKNEISKAKAIIEHEEGKFELQNALMQTLAEAFKSVKE